MISISDRSTAESFFQSYIYLSIVWTQNAMAYKSCIPNTISMHVTGKYDILFQCFLLFKCIQLNHMYFLNNTTSFMKLLVIITNVGNYTK